MKTITGRGLILFLQLFLTYTLQGQGAININEEELLYKLIQEEISFENKVLVLLQFERNISRKDRLILKERGVELQEFLRSDTAYLAVVNKSILPNALNEFLPFSVKKHETINKISSNLQEALRLRSFPDYAFRTDGKIKITLRYLKGFSTEGIKNFLTEKGVEIEYAGDKSRRITCWINPQKTEKLMEAAFVLSAELAAAKPVPEYDRDRSNHRANFLSQDFSAGYSYKGDGIKVMLQDDGLIGPHIDYTGRISDQYLSFNNGDHGDHCAGILMGAGNKDPLTKGMAWGSDIFVYGAGGYQGFDSIYTHYFSKNITISSTSYADGCNAGYTSLAASLDEQINDLPLLMHVFSAGNAGTQDCNYGAGAGWGNITGGHKHSKNSIAVGNLDHLDNLASSSSRGPVHDGRLKPEVCAVGTSVYSTIDSHNYDTKTGTSMACPGVAGALAMLSEAYLDQHGTLPHSSLLKAMLMNTADDLGNTGPDYKFGYGRINGRKMLQPVLEQRFIIDSVSTGQTNIHQIFIPSGLQQVKVMICWNDYPAAEAANIALINDLDLTIQNPSGFTQLPLVLNPTPDPLLLNSTAIPGTDHLNNHEQAILDFPQAGNYQIHVNGLDIPFGPQTYSLTWYFEELKELVLTYPNGGEAYAPGENINLRWDASADTQSFALSYSVDSGQTWTDINTTVSPALRSVNFQIPALANAKSMKIKIERGAFTDESDRAFNVLGIPQNLQILWTCPDSLLLKWTAVNGASNYDIFMLGNKYMDSVGTTQADSFIIRNINAINNQYWLSVRARTPDGIAGRRANAIQSNISNFCPVNTDVEVTEIQSPSGPYYTCMNISEAPVRIAIINKGLRNISQIPLFYSVDSGPAYSATVNDTLAFMQSLVFSFTAGMNISNPGNYILRVWTSLPGDSNSDNDTLQMIVRQIQSAIVSPPWIENFENSGLCSTAPDCGLSECLLNNGMLNALNGLEDDTDWRINSGATPTSNTGPAQDYLPGTATGKYLYMEASGICAEKEAVLLSPCIDLSNFSNPRLTFSYHMYGSEIGDLSIDIFANGNWINSVFFRTGDQGTDWEVMNIPLSAYSGQTIIIRFRGSTAGGESGDMAIDGIMIGNVSGMDEISDLPLRIVPNPGRDKFFVFPPADILEEFTLKLFTAEGKCVLNQNISRHDAGKSIEINTGEFTAGIYLISLGDGHLQLREKLIIQP